MPMAPAFHSDVKGAFRSERSILQAIQLAREWVNLFSFRAAKAFPLDLAKLPFSFWAMRLEMATPPALATLSFSLAMRMATVILPERAKFSSFYTMLLTMVILRASAISFLPQRSLFSFFGAVSALAWKTFS
jgi:hypothetical protein